MPLCYYKNMEFGSSKIIGSIGALVAVALLAFFAFFWNKEDINLSYPESNDFSTQEDIGSSPVGFRDIFVPVVRPLEPVISYIDGVFLNEEPVTENPPTIFSGNEPRNTQNPLLSEEQVFDTIWPESYRNALITLQDLMIKDGFILETEKKTHITSDDDVYATLLSIASYAVKQGWTESANFNQLKAGIQELERVVARERTNLRMTGKVSADVLLPGGQRIDKTPHIKQDFFSMIIDGLKYSLITGEAHAQIPGAPGWHTIPDCYKDLAPNPSPGVSLWAFCCNCGLLCTPSGCVRVRDCGPGGLLPACNVPLGCLNLMCFPFPNAVWDAFWNPPPGTGICGCG